jgi:hypothetical protein
LFRRRAGRADVFDLPAKPRSRGGFAARARAEYRRFARNVKPEKTNRGAAVNGATNWPTEPVARSS